MDGAPPSVAGERPPAPEGTGADDRDGRIPPARPRRAWTTRKWLTAGVTGALVVLLALSAAGAWVFARTSDVSDQAVKVNAPALIASVRLEDALINQETGVRGYGLAGQTSFLEPYQDGLGRQRDSTAQLRGLLADQPRALGDLKDLLAKAEVWQSGFARPVAAAPPGAPVALAAQRADEAKAEFDAIRASSTRLQRTLQTAQNHSRAELDRIHRDRDWIFTFIALVVLALLGLSFAGLRRGVTKPLTRLSADVRRVAGGDFAHPVASGGPADMRALAADVESMRERLAGELAFTHAARQRLDAQAADLQRSNAELEQFAYVASHDLQEPLRKVASFCQLLQRRYAEQLDERAEQYIGYAVDGANRMQTLITDLLSFSRVGRVHAETSQVDLEAIFTATADTLSLAVADAGARLTHDPLPTVSGDTTQLGMLLQNLLSNAVKFRSPDRAPHIHLSAERDGDLWSFAVTDNGIGIAPEFAERVFVIFQRLHTRDSYPGNGIGLALCKKIVEYHGGTIGLDPDHSPGTRICFTLAAGPRVLEPGADPAEAAAP